MQGMKRDTRRLQGEDMSDRLSKMIGAESDTVDRVDWNGGDEVAEMVRDWKNVGRRRVSKA